MSQVDVVAVALWVGVVAYAVFGGADFGAGFWDLFAGDADRGARPRALIDEAIGPVWEANHVWLIYCLVVLWTAFSPAFTAIMTTLTLPLLLAGFGIVLRGSGFAFRKASVDTSSRRLYGAAFATSSVITPFAMGLVAGAIASGRVPPGNAQGDVIGSWLNPTSILGGLLAVAACSYLSAVFLVCDARRIDEPELTRYFLRRAIGAAVVAGALALIGIGVLHADARQLFDGLTGRALPVVVASVLAGAGGFVVLVRHGPPRLARVLAVGAVGGLVASWGVAQYPYILPPAVTLESVASPAITLSWVLGVAVLAVVLIGPALGLLYVLDQRSRL